MLSIAFARPATILPLASEITCIKKILQCIILESKSRMCKRSIEIFLLTALDIHYLIIV